MDIIIIVIIVNDFSCRLSHVLFELQMFGVLQLDLNVAFIQDISVGVSSLEGFHITSRQRSCDNKKFHKYCKKELQ